MTCDARILWNVHWIDSEGEDRIAKCTLAAGHLGEHAGTQENPVIAIDGLPSETTIHWLESDRRNFRGEMRHCRQKRNCVLPKGHRGNHAL